jgi:pilus assembly protein CpaF
MSLLKRIGATPGATGDLSQGQTARPASIPRPESGRSSGQDDNATDLKVRVQNRLLNELDPKMDLSNIAKVRQQVEEIFNSILDSESIVLTRTERARMFEAIAADIIGFGPLEQLLNDVDISEIMVNGPKKIYVEKRGKVQRSNVTFNDDQHVLRVIDRIVAPLGRRIDESSPMVDARLPDGSRVNAVIRPLALCGPTLSIRKFKKDGVSVEDLIRFGSITREMAEFLAACVKASLNIVVSGGTGSGKTTMLNALSSFIPDDQRIVTVENAAELQLRQDHVVPLESRPSNVEGKGEISIRDLVINCLRMRPDRIVVGECRGGEALEMLQAMNTGHDGSMTTLHANTPRDAIARIETMCLMSGMDLPVRAIREQIASAVNLIVQLSRLKDGSRKTVYITEVQGMEGDVVVLSDIFIFEQQGLDERGKIIGQLKPTGLRPRFVDRFEENNIYLPPNIFGFSGMDRF